MPQRTNEFQQLIYVIKQNVATDAVVTESKLLRDQVTGTKREVDVCIEKPVGGHSVTISIECRDRRRSASVGWVEEMVKKHERLPTNVLALVSSSGFTKEALEVAKIYKAETISLGEVSSNAATQIVGKLSSLWCKTVELTPERCSVRVQETKGLPAETVRVLPDNIIFSVSGSEIDTVGSSIRRWLSTPKLLEDLFSLDTESGEWFEVCFDCHVMESPAGSFRIYLRKEEPRVLRTIEWVRVVGKCHFIISEFPLKHGTLNDVHVAWGSGKVADRDSLLVIEEQTNTQPNFSLRMKP